MISRRETLHLAAAFAATRGAMFAVSPEEAAAALAAPAQREPGAGRRGDAYRTSVETQSPVGFMEMLDSLDWGDRQVMHDPQRWAAYKHALLAVRDAVRQGQETTAVLDLLDQLDEGAVDMATVSWLGGVTAGTAYEHLRLAMTVPVEICLACDGYGRRREDRKAGRPVSESATCATCDGTGVVSLRRPVLALAAGERTDSW